MSKGKLINMTIEERVQLFFDIQQKLTDDLGLAFAVKHGEDFPLYDLWEEELLQVKINKGATIKKQDGKVTVEEFDRMAEESERGKANDKQREESEGRSKKTIADRRDTSAGQAAVEPEKIH